MSDALIIPDDPQACRALLVELTQSIESQQQELIAQRQKIAALEQKKSALQLEIQELLQRAFQKRSERYLEDPNQLKIDFGNTPEAAAAAGSLADAIIDNRVESADAVAETVIPEHRRRKPVKRRARQEQLPAHLPRYEVTLEAPADVHTCPT